MNDKVGFSINGYAVFIVLLVAAVFVFKQSTMGDINLLTILVALPTLFSITGFFIVQPNQAKVMTFFGSYVGTVKAGGLRWTIPLFIRKNISLRIRNFESNQMKVNDNLGNPIEIATVVV